MRYALCDGTEAKECMSMSGMYSRNKYFDTFYLTGAQDLPELERDVYLEFATSATMFERYEDYLEDGWPEFIIDFSE